MTTETSSLFPPLNIKFNSRAPSEDDWLPDFLALPCCTPFQAACVLEDLQPGEELPERKTILFIANNGYELENWIQEHGQGIIERVSQRTHLFTSWFQHPEIPPLEAIAKALKQNFSVSPRVIGHAMEQAIMRVSMTDSSQLRSEIDDLRSQLRITTDTLTDAKTSHAALQQEHDALKALSPSKSDRGIDHIRRREKILAAATYYLAHHRDSYINDKDKVVASELSKIIDEKREMFSIPESGATMETILKTLRAAIGSGRTLQDGHKTSLDLPTNESDGCSVTSD